MDSIDFQHRTRLVFGPRSLERLGKLAQELGTTPGRLWSAILELWQLGTFNAVWNHCGPLVWSWKRF